MQLPAVRRALQMKTPAIRIVPAYLEPTQKALFEDFEDINDWTAGGTGASVAADTTNFRTGTQGVAVTGATSGITNTATKTINTDMSAVTQMQYSVYIPNAAALADITGCAILVANDAFSNYYQFVTLVANLAVGWNHITINRADWTGVGSDPGPSWDTAMVRLRVRWTHVANTNSVTLTFDNVRTGVPGMPAVLLSFDDGRLSQFTKAWPLMQERGLKATIYVVTDDVGTADKVTWTHLHALNEAGWDIGNHTDDHTSLATLDLATQQGHLLTAMTALNSNGLSRASRYAAYPAGSYDATTITAMADLGDAGNTAMLCGRTTVNNRAEVCPPRHWYTLAGGGLAITNVTTLTEVTDAISTAITNNTMINLVFHDIADTDIGEYSWLAPDFIAVLNYIIAKKLPVLTISEYYNLASAKCVEVTLPAQGA